MNENCERPLGVVQSYRDLKVWQLGMEITTEVYRLTASFPKHEIYGLTSQMRRSASSIPANIAEGHGRDSTKEFLHLLSISRGSLSELETFFFLAKELDYGEASQVSKILDLLDEESRMLRGLQKSLKSKVSNRNPHPSSLTPRP